MSDREKEKIRLRATYFNGIAMVLMAAGAIGPYVAIAQTFNREEIGYTEVVSTLFFVLGFAWFSMKAHEKAVAILDQLSD